ncbi:ubiquinol-cytochrome-c reductase complex assembly factor 2 [Biomphalaria glabrata]|uniref:Mitochondrial nucleoid factor 1 n=1 Tax=Biomphalaria glabrata TaxID=6526 RepID=A0A9W3AEL7_BIOGL|nr:ubiquinol-cytochrome-c reductase complex assembly factor 2-like [Biomphalaria glabrata]KAI8749492.1 ubiquinol-cytochrome-c reductase complex assembly factor 2-like [Biomphalaria glabrata]KAI8786734.1 ubiquinol-cytochrome-c reductase complex assembly factor 2 [Biomphalaria glabrata]
MAASRYRSLLQLMKQWPVKEFKGKRSSDLGDQIKKQILTKFPQGEASTVDEKECDNYYNSLVRISNDVHKKKWERPKITNASGANEEELRNALYSEEEEDKPLIERLKATMFAKSK